MATTYEALDRQTFYRTYLSLKTRRDGRKFDEYRSTTVNVKSLSNAEGSAIVRLGETTVVCGVKAELAKPKTETPEDGYIVANVTLLPICSPEFSSGPPSDRAQLSSLLLTRALTETGAIDLKQLCIVPSKLVWVVYIDALCINDDGGLLGASVAAATAALMTMSLPEVQFNAETGQKSVDTSRRKQFVLNATPFATRFAFYDEDQILHDPTAEEESLSSGEAIIISCVRPEESMVVSVTGSRPISATDLNACMLAAKTRAKILGDVVTVASGSPER